jgi:hypothetical protein
MTYVLHDQELRRKFLIRILTTPTLRALDPDTDEFAIIHATLQLWTESSRTYRRMSAAMARACSNGNYSYVLMRPCLAILDEARGDLLRGVRE